MTLIAIFIAMIFLHSLASGRLERTIVTAPIMFTVGGMLTLLALPEMRDHKLGHEAFLAVAEIGLVLLLFTDASRTDLRVLKNIRNLPFRLLSIGMLLTIALGALCARVVFPQLSVWECGILAAILAPTDAGLGQIIVSSLRVPTKIRQALNVEAGLNDGLSVPFLLFFIALTVGVVEGERASLPRFIVEQLGFGALVGLGTGLIGGWMLGTANRLNWMAHSWRPLGVLTLPLFCALVSEKCGASMFIAAFVAGLVVQIGFKDAAKHSIEFTEEWGQLFNLSVFFLFGMLVARAWPHFKVTHAVYAALSLTVVRMLPVAIALLGTRMHRATVVFMGWFGPRGLASIVLGLVYLEQLTHQPTDSTIPLVVMITVLFSIFAHGLSAMPGMEIYARQISALHPDAPELQNPEAQASSQSLLPVNPSQTPPPP